MKINVSGVLRSINSSIAVDGEIDVPSIVYMGDEISVNTPIKVSAKITNTGGSLLLAGRIYANLTLKCSRCLESFNYNFENDFEEELSNNSDDEDVVHFEGDTIELTDIIVNNILLYLPMKVVCRENCEGLCPVCGSNLNAGGCSCTGDSLDPRLEVLKKLLKDN